MKVKKSIAAAAVLMATGAAFAAEAPQAAGATTVAAGASGAATAAAAASPSALPAARDAAKQESADVVKNYKTPLAIQLEQYRN